MTHEISFWRGVIESVYKDSLKSFDEAAKQVVSITTLLKAIYVSVVSFSEVREGIRSLQDFQQELITFLLLLPLIFWLLSLLFATQVFIPREYPTNLASPEKLQDTYQRIARDKSSTLKKSHLLLILGFIPLLINIIYFLLFFPIL